MVKVIKTGAVFSIISQYTPEEIDVIKQYTGNPAIIRQDANGNEVFYYDFNKEHKGMFTKKGIIFNQVTEDGFAYLMVNVPNKTLDEFIKEYTDILVGINVTEDMLSSLKEDAVKTHALLKANATENKLTRLDNTDIGDFSSEETVEEGDEDNA